MPISKVYDAERLAALNGLGILDTSAEAGFDDIVLLANQICETPVALVSLVGAERQWFKARIGFEPCETPLSQSVCAHAIEQGSMLVIPDLTLDERTKHNTLVTEEPHIRFYAGALLKTAEGQAIGTLCVIDGQPRPEGLTQAQVSGLSALANQVMAQLELRRVARSEAEARRKSDESTTRYEAIFESAVDYAIIVMSREGLIVDWNEGAKRILGWTAAEICGHDLSAFFTPEDREAKAPEKEMESARTKGRGIDERWHLRKNGERFWANGELMPLMSADGALDGYVKILRDRTAQRLSEDRIALNDERLQMALSASGVVGLWDWMIDSDLLHGDANFARLYGLDIQQAAAGVTMEEYQKHVVAEDLAPLRAKIKAVFDDDARFFAEYRLSIPGEALRWLECKGKIIRAADGRALRFSGTAVDITERKAAEAQKHLLMEELAHRVKNSFAVVQAIASQTLRRADPAIAESFQSRLLALSRAHDVLLQTSWSSATMASLMDSVLGLQAEASRFVVAGPEVEIGSKAALSISLLMHEMATNAVKYGALSVETGKVSIKWSIENQTLRLDWRETGGPAAKAPEKKGFGSRLIGLGICGTQGTELHYGERGLVAKFTAPMAVVQSV